MNKDAIEELKYSIEPNQGLMECRAGTISEETIKLAIEALEKQVPKKPIYGGANTRCPNCGEVLLYFANVSYSDQ